MEIYDNAFADTNVYGHVVRLLSEFKLERGDVVVDVGCGYGRIAESLRDRFGIRYVGFDGDDASVQSLKDRGFEASSLVVGRDSVGKTMRSALPGDKPVSAILALDFLEHLVDPEAMLCDLIEVARQSNAPLIISVPNVGHRDLGAKLAFGHFDYTESGLLDRTHIQFFTAGRLADLMKRVGWHEVGSYDLELAVSDQCFPATMPGLSTATPLGQALGELRAQADPFGTVNQFIRSYLPGPQGARVEVAAARSPFLSVVIRTMGTRISTLREGLLCLSAQSDQDFEVLIVGHNLKVDAQIEVERLIEQLHESFRIRVRLLLVHGGGRTAPLNAGFADGRGEYVVAFDDDDLLFGGWVEAFKAAASKGAGRLLRQCTVAQDWDRIRCREGGVVSRSMGPMRAIYPKKFDFIAHLVENRTPLHSIAFPRSLFTHLGFRFDDGHSTAEDWDLIVRVAPICGVTSMPDIGCIYRHWVGGDSSYTAHTQFEWTTNYVKTLKKLDDSPLLLPAGSANRLRRMFAEIERLQGNVDPDQTMDTSIVDLGPDDEGRLAALRERYFDLVTSRSWRITSPVRAVMRKLRKQPWDRGPKIWQMTESDLDFHIRQILGSASWKWTSILRGLRR